MFDANNFQGVLKTQAEQVGPNAVAKLYLHNGTEYLIRDVVEAHAGYVLLNVHATFAKVE